MNVSKFRCNRFDPALYVPCIWRPHSTDIVKQAERRSIFVHVLEEPFEVHLFERNALGGKWRGCGQGFALTLFVSLCESSDCQFPTTASAAHGGNTELVNLKVSSDATFRSLIASWPKAGWNCFWQWGTYLTYNL